MTRLYVSVGFICWTVALVAAYWATRALGLM